jgi:peptidoglycan hydrolase-like protein with peptidoglycan-binding domain
VPTTHVDLASAEPWRRSLQRSQARRGATRRRLRRRFRRRGVSVALTVAMTAFAGAALAAGGGAPSPVAVLSSGARGSEVAAVQAALGIPADGVYGPRTRRAVRAFQAAHGLTVDGIVGPQTRAALGLRSTPADTPAAGDGSGSTLEQIAQCESSGDPSAVSGDGRYRGKYQFDRATWRELGGTGDPAAVPEAEQDRIAAKLMARQGPSAWPNCA